MLFRTSELETGQLLQAALTVVLATGTLATDRMLQEPTGPLGHHSGPCVALWRSEAGFEQIVQARPLLFHMSLLGRLGLRLCTDWYDQND